MLLGAVYFVLIMPIGLCMRLFGRDAMEIRKHTNSNSNFHKVKRQCSLENFKNFKIIIVSIDKKSIKDQLNFLKKNKVNGLTTYFDKEMIFFKSLKLRGIPTTLLIKKKK